MESTERKRERERVVVMVVATTEVVVAAAAGELCGDAARVAAGGWVSGG